MSLEELKALLVKNNVELNGELTPETIVGELGMDSFDIMMLSFDLESVAGHELKLTLNDTAADILNAVNNVG
ncbi:hypothetical protein SAMN02910447_02017 [Ruminococcus sp. YE71]|uniref:acyl carrier protein n=1 Tax=unclassified Ruminococcus TaxID=2608920 RepID=UPI00088203B5|nr:MULTISPECIES: acyl carrier protein [unclassified Ruminococcus]SDA26029.1 hypothetical protein SAMN02910446_02601 [Ruminococcus sp. YE78]SFW35796.1 hypothetical protein SAMN02910447_02017 [Ruminococcus sp. YE71]